MQMCWLPRMPSTMRSMILGGRSEEHTSELQSRSDLVCRLLLEKKKKNLIQRIPSAELSSGKVRRAHENNINTLVRRKGKACIRNNVRDGILTTILSTIQWRTR